MSEIRYDVLSGDFAIIATERVKRPSDWGGSTKDKAPSRDFDAACPFCPGNESQTPPELYALRENGEPDGPGWSVRCVPNKFPALQKPDGARGSDRAPKILDTSMYWRTEAVGAHEVVIETQSHNAGIGSYHKRHLGSVLDVLFHRQKALYDEDFVKYVQIFKNHGAAGGASLAHPHFQVVALPVTPKALVKEGERFKAHEVETGRCFLCDLVEREMEKDVRVLANNADFVAVSPFAARFAFEALVVPRRHTLDLAGLGRDGLLKLAEILVDLFRMYEALFPDLPYNMVFHGIPDSAEHLIGPPYHAHIHVYPRLSIHAGLELGAGAYINPSPPELAAAQMRAAVSSKEAE